MDNFARRYKKLNTAQQEAVDIINGPVMVIAGPGTGKTELLSMRVANILKETDVSPQNILCLTFTESGANAMRERLFELMGQAAYKVTIHTFHSFGSEIISENPDYFYSGAHFRPADELSSYEVLKTLFKKLPHTNPLSSKMNDEYTQLRSVRNTISDFKKSGLTPDEIQKILDHNTLFLDYTEPLLQEVLASRISKATVSALSNTLKDIESYQEEELSIPNATGLSMVFADQLRRALEVAETENTTKPITEWKNSWLEKSSDNIFVFKDRKRIQKLRAASFIYANYLKAMQESSLYDYDDMILRVAHALEVFDDLRFNLQEKYQYILVDEFQDTNGAQMRILSDLTNNEVNNEKPNILVVGDDDQAIYSFQGADVGNIIVFRDRFPALKTITLTDNYRSASAILDRSRQVITQGSERIESYLEGIDKTLAAKNEQKNSSVQLAELPSQNDEFYWVIQEIKRRIEKGQAPNTMAVLSRSHKDIAMLLPYFSHENIAVHYEHKDDVLQQPPIVALTDIATILTNLVAGRADAVNAALPQFLSHPAWNLPAESLWRLSIKAHNERKFWLEIMLEEDGRLQEIAQWLITTAHTTTQQPLDISLDILLGNSSSDAMHSPFFDYFFSKEEQQNHPETYLSYLRGLQLLRQKLTEYLPEKALYLKDFVDFIAMHKEANLKINAETDPTDSSLSAVHIMTAHKAKGKEFETVFIVNATDNTWGIKSRGRSQRLSYPENLPIAPAGESADERLRLFFVAMTRAKRELIISYAVRSSADKQTLIANFLHSEDGTILKPKALEKSAQITSSTQAWQSSILETTNNDFKEYMKDHLKNYKLSPTHLNNFIDIVNCGPQDFFMQNILQFPQASHPSAAFGSAIHKTLQKAHLHLTATKERRPLEDVLHDFEILLKDQRLSENNYEYYLQKGSDALQTFLDARYDSFHVGQKVESNFGSQHSTLDDVRLTGAIDVMEVDQKAKSIIITDYKTGKPATGWKGKDEYQKIKLHRYKQQLFFYKLLVENSRTYNTFSVNTAILDFIEPEKEGGEVRQLALAYDAKELDEFIVLLKAVWKKIKNIDLPDTANYEQNYKGILQFEEDLKKDLI